MSNELCLIRQQLLTDIADAIRAKNGESTTYYPSEMAGAIEDIEAGEGITPTGSINITTNGTHNVADYANAVVNVPGITPTGSINISTNGTHDVTNYASAVVNVSAGGGTSGEYRISYPTSTPNQTLDFSYTNRHTKSNGVLTLKMDSVTMTLTPHTGYLAGHIVINGIDTGQSSINAILADNDIITVTAAEEKVISNYNLDTAVTLGQSGYYMGYSSIGSYGSMSDYEMWYYQYSGQQTPSTAYITEVNFAVYNPSSDIMLSFSVSGFGTPVVAEIYVGDSSTSNYWTAETSSFPYSLCSFPSSIYDYLMACENNQTPVPIKVLLANNP